MTDHIAWTDDLLVESDQVPASGSVSSDDAIEEEDEEPENVESDFEQTLEINGDQNEDDEDEDEDEIASDEGESFHDSPDNGDDGEYDLEEEDEGPYAHDYDEDDLLVPVLKMKGDRLPILDENMPSAAKHPRGFHSRGLYPRAKMYNRDNNLKWMYGECEDELIPIVIVKHKWMDQPTLPTANQDEEGRGGMSMPLYYTEERKREDTEEFCAWYRDRGGGKVMDQAQQMEAVDEETAKEYFPPAWPEHEVLMGPLNNQQRHKVGLRESVPLTEASSTTSQDRPAEQSNQNGELNQDPGYLQNQGHEHDVSERRESLHSQDQDLALSEVGRIEPQETQEQENTVQPRKRGRKPKNPKKSNVMVGVCNGFILNLGSKICSMDWAPTSDQGTSQYLAVCQVIKPPSSHEHTSPFVPTLPYKSSIQIWEFKTIQRDEGKPYRTIDASQAPRLIHVICTEWGFGQEVRWCPFYQPPDELYEDEEDGKKHIGVLAVIFSDGHLRVLNISIDTRRNARAKVYGVLILQARESPDT